MTKKVEIIKSTIGDVLNITELYDGGTISVFSGRLSRGAKYYLSYGTRRMNEIVSDSAIAGRFVRLMMCRELKARVNDIARDVFNGTFSEHCGAEFIPRWFGRYGYGIMLSWRKSVVPESLFMSFVTGLDQPDGGKYLLVKKGVSFEFKKLNESGETKTLYVVLVIACRQ